MPNQHGLLWSIALFMPSCLPFYTKLLRFFVFITLPTTNLNSFDVLPLKKQILSYVWWWYQINLLNESIRKFSNEFHITNWVIFRKWYWMFDGFASGIAYSFELTLCCHSIWYHFVGGYLLSFDFYLPPRR